MPVERFAKARSGLVCRIILPERMCGGTLATWASGEDSLNAGAQ